MSPVLLCALLLLLSSTPLLLISLVALIPSYVVGIGSAGMWISFIGALLISAVFSTFSRAINFRSESIPIAAAATSSLLTLSLIIPGSVLSIGGEIVFSDDALHFLVERALVAVACVSALVGFVEFGIGYLVSKTKIGDRPLIGAVRMWVMGFVLLSLGGSVSQLFLLGVTAR